ncbi:hypothetical protein AAMO2058_001568400 [Amorphochlora amoebiformis]|uniref:Amidophosphoribosyltransferase n=1 Tax=Amorphochlora amoebiformis TaxID=1561963 RepID=A0A7S0DMU7_9EUKA|mmetsp:Transcript_33774/g.54409  ORF Transcript_33774/g.54409 Transcript_33774/m.54409 type:complete len:576 (+) Transcript_33774:55-1782(+)
MELEPADTKNYNPPGMDADAYECKDGARPKCAVFGICSGNRGPCDAAASQFAYFGLHAQQHRGQESAGILSMEVHDAVSAANKKRKREDRILPPGDKDLGRGWRSHPNLTALHPRSMSRIKGKGLKVKTHIHKDFGLVTDVFTKEILPTLTGGVAIGHTRYSTSGSDKTAHNIQPFLVKYRDGHIGLTHNGDICNFRKIQEQFVKAGTLFHSTSDSELILHLISRSQKKTQPEQVMEALSILEGAFSILMITENYFFALRDPNGFRPLHMGVITSKRPDSKEQGPKKAPFYVFASETCAFDLIGAKLIREVEPGEIIVIDLNRASSHTQFKSLRLPRKYGVTPCIFEYVYFARADSYIFGSSVDQVRYHCGQQLARESPVPKGSNVVVIPVPTSANVAALGYANECKKMGYDVRYDLGLVRNNYVGRTFITPGQVDRALKVRRKFGVSKRVVKGAIVVLVDDSIVRGTTSMRLVNLLKENGAKEVHFRSASPPVKNPCFFGMDFPNPKELIANKHDDIKSIGSAIGAESLAYLSWEGLKSAVMETKPSSTTWCGACFTGSYPVPTPRAKTKTLDW